MQPTLPVVRALLPLAALCVGAAPLAAQGGRVFPVQTTQSQPSDNSNLPSTTERLTGIVVSSVDGAPVPRALVTTPDQRFAAFTDSQGRFAFDLRRALPTGAPQQSGTASTPELLPSAIFVSFSFRKPGYVAATLSLSLSATQPDTPEPPLTFKLVPTATVTGQLYTDSSDLPQSLVVQLLRRQVNNGKATWLPANAAAPNTGGEYRIANLEPGQYKLRVPAVTAHSDADPTAPGPASRSGFLPIYYPNSATEDGATILPAGAGDSITANLRLRTAPFYQVTVPLASPPDKQSFQAVLLNAPPGLNLRQNGQSFTGYLPDGAYDLLLYSVVQPSPNTSAQQIAPQMSDAMVKLDVAGKSVRTLPVALHPIPDIPIIVRREFTSGQPQQASPPNQPSIFVFLQNVRQDIQQPAPSMKPTTGDEGLALMGATPGLYTVIVFSPAGSASYVASATSGTTDLLREPLQVLADSNPRPIEVTLRDDFASVDATITGDPASPPSTPESPGMLLCIPLDHPQTMPAFAPLVQNHATVPNLAPGRYLLLAGNGQQFLSVLEYTNEEVLRTLLSKGVVVTLAPNDKATVQVPLFPDGGN